MWIDQKPKVVWERKTLIYEDYYRFANSHFETSYEKKLSKVKVTKYLKYVQLLKAKTKTNEKFLQRKFVEKNKAKWEGTFEPPKTKSL